MTGFIFFRVQSHVQFFVVVAMTGMRTAWNVIILDRPLYLNDAVGNIYIYAASDYDVLSRASARLRHIMKQPPFSPSPLLPFPSALVTTPDSKSLCWCEQRMMVGVAAEGAVPVAAAEAGGGAGAAAAATAAVVQNGGAGARGMETSAKKNSLSMFQVARQVYGESGILGFYRGFYISILQFAPTSAVSVARKSVYLYVYQYVFFFSWRPRPPR